MRIVLTLPPELTQEAMDRIELFCCEHFRTSAGHRITTNTGLTLTTTKEPISPALTTNGTAFSNEDMKDTQTSVVQNGRSNHQDKENAVNGSAKLPGKKLSLSAMLSSNLSNLLAVDPEENDMLVQVFQK